MTFAERLRIGLRSAGYQPDPSDRSKYEAFTHPSYPGSKLFVGPNGALRQGRCATESWSLGDPTRRTPLYLKFLAADNPTTKGVMNYV